MPKPTVNGFAMLLSNRAQFKILWVGETDITLVSPTSGLTPFNLSLRDFAIRYRVLESYEVDPGFVTTSEDV